jgi:hypothetical protein
LATFVSVWRGNAAAMSQGMVATVFDLALGLGLTGTALTLLPGGSPEVYWLLFRLSPVFLIGQLVAAVVAWLLIRPRKQPDQRF